MRIRPVIPLDRSLRGKRVLITGGSRGLGLAIARDCASRGARLVLCARDRSELQRARDRFLVGAEVEVHECDITDRGQIQTMLKSLETQSRKVDILVNNAGVIDVGPLSAFDPLAFESALEVNLLGMIRMTLDTLPLMPRGARIINITSIGGAVAVPHLLPYSVSKFGAVGFSLGLDAEVANRGISVTTVLPGLMRTGSFVQAMFRGNSRKEFGWFAWAASMPGITMSAERAAQRIIRAGINRERFVVLGLPARLLRVAYVLLPATALAAFRLVARFLPRPVVSRNAVPVQGKILQEHLPRSRFRRLGSRAGERLNQNAA